MANIFKEVRDFNRFKKIIIILIEEGFDFLVDKIKLRHHVDKKPKSKKINKKETPEIRIRKLFERLGPTFIKLGQILSLRPDLIPPSYAKELEGLLDKVPPFPYTDVKKVIEDEFGKPIKQIFSSFDKKPIASASVSQVHKAKLKNGDIVAVKIQRPDIRKIMDMDIDIMFYIAKLLEKHYPRVGKFHPIKIVEDFKSWTEKELNFKLEARNATRFYQNFKNSKSVKIPKIYEKLVTKDVMVSEYIDGVEITKLKSLKKKIDLDKIMTIGLDAVLTMVFEHGLFHADPHPANILVTKDNKIAFVDFGIVGFFDDKLKNKAIDLLYGIIEYDPDMIVDTLMSMGMETKNIDENKFRSDIANIIEPLRYSSIKDIKISYVLEEVIAVPLKHDFKIPIQFVLFGKSIVTLEGIALEYNPNFNVVEATKPFLEKLLKKRTNPAYIFKSFLHNFNRYRRLADNLPEKANKALDNLSEGKFQIEVKDKEIKKLAIEMDKSSNRITFGLIIAALLITSAMTIQFDKGPVFFNIPFISLLSFFVAVFLSILLFISIVKEKHAHFNV